MTNLDELAAAINDLAGKVAALIALEAVRGGLTSEQIEAARKLMISATPSPVAGKRPAPSIVATQTLNKIASVSASLATIQASGQQGKD